MPHKWKIHIPELTKEQQKMHLRSIVVKWKNFFVDDVDDPLAMEIIEYDGIRSNKQ